MSVHLYINLVFQYYLKGPVFSFMGSNKSGVFIQVFMFSDDPIVTYPLIPP